MRKTILIGSAVFGLLIASLITGQMGQKRNLPTVKRAKRPKFAKRDWDQTFFENIFRDGFVGDRPPNLGESSTPRVVTKSGGTPSSGGAVKANKWSEIIERGVIEDEIKRLQIKLETEVTTPTKYKSDHHKARLTFSILAMMFAIVEEYDSDVRWKKDSPYARVAFARAAANARTGSEQAYQNAKKQKENLKELVRGASFPQDGKISEEWDWVDVIDRGPVMEKLELIYQGSLKPNAASQAEFRSKMEEILHGASLIAALAEVMSKPSSEDSDDEDFVAHLKTMKEGAMQVVSGTKANTYALVEKGVNSVGQSCTNCHDDFR